MESDLKIPFGTKKPSIFYYNIHLFRGLAILLVVFHHTARTNFSNWLQLDPGIIPHFIDTFALRNCTVIYVFISGFLFQALIERYSCLPYFTKKIKYVILPYLIMSLPMVFMVPLIIGTNLLESLHYTHLKQPIQRIVWGFLVGNTVPSYWYIPVICLLFCCAPIFVWMNRFPKLYVLIIPLLYIATISGRPTMETNPFQNFAYFLPTYMVGILFAKYHHLLGKKNRSKIACCSLSISIILALLQVTILKGYGTVLILSYTTDYFAFDINIFQKLFFCFFLVNYLPTRSNWLNSSLAKLSDASFAIFFIHDYINLGIYYLVKSWSLDLSIPTGIGTHLAVFTFVLSFSYFVALLIKQLSGRYSRLIIGW
jgi:probable poly-beta-1,6-N-acetyl-D-glucosamine export protein